ncbi:MAG: hypothetical protein IPF82_13220 [Blastocatellia bacterium]|nr:hypothetical protein [Blastocatellia bacterium]
MTTKNRHPWMTAIAGVLISTAGTVAAQTPATLVASHAEAAQAAKLGQEAYAAGKLDVFLVEMLVSARWDCRCRPKRTRTSSRSLRRTVSVPPAPDLPPIQIKLARVRRR